MSNFFITTAIDYANGKPHIGHAYEKISCDVLARWNRQINNKEEVFFLTGTDEHGQKIFDTAKENNVEVQKFVDTNANEFIEFTKKLNLSNDYFIRTTNEDHKKYVQEYLQKSFDNKDIYLSNYDGYYCVGCEKYFDKKDLDEDFNCLIHKKKCEKKNEENYFFKLSNYQDKLLKLYEENPDFISPKSKRNEILNRVKEGLNDISISRKKENLSWGIELPFDKNHVTYVWFDALFNYLTSLKINNKLEFWPASIHVIGHDISWFHCVYWPAFLMSVNEKLPNKVFSHGMLLDKNGHKMSKSLGNVIDSEKQIEKYGLEEFKYYLLSMGTFGEDLKYDENKLIEKINNDLNNDFGNLASRIHTMIKKYFDLEVPVFNKNNLTEKVDIDFIENQKDFFDIINKEYKTLNFSKILNLIFEKIRLTNSYINEVEPWKITDKKRLEIVSNNLVSFLKFIGFYLKPFMPKKIKELENQFNF